MSDLTIPLKTHPLPPISFILTVKITIPPSSIPTWFEHFRPCHAAVLAEPECVYFVVGQNPQVPGEIWWSEGWRHERGVDWFMDTQLKKGYYQPYLEITEKMFLKPRQAEIFIPEKGMMNFKLPKDGE